MDQTVASALERARLYSDNMDYRILRLPAGAITLAAGVVAEGALPFIALVVDKDEVTLLLPDEVCAEFSGRLRHAIVSEQVYRLITLDVPLEPYLVGFVARISACLAAAGVPILPYAAHSRDHILVPVEHFATAIGALEALQGQD